MSVLVPTSLDGALAALAADPDAHVLAGGTDLMVEVNFGHRRPASVVAINRIAELSDWHRSADGAHVVLGAGVTYRTMEHGELARLVPALAQAARTVGSPQIRNAATIGGNLATCSPAGDGLPVLSALDATIELASVTGRRMVSVHEFMVGVKRTVRRADELIVAVHLPVLRGWQGYAKVGVRNAMVIATATVCLATDLDGHTVRIAMGAVGPTVIRARNAEAWIATQIDWTTGALIGNRAAITAELGKRVRTEARPIDDHRSTAAYRRHAVGVLAGRLLTRAFPT